MPTTLTDETTPCDLCGVTFAEIAEYERLLGQSGDRGGDRSRISAYERDRVLALKPLADRWGKCDHAPHELPRSRIEEPTPAEVTDALGQDEVTRGDEANAMLARLGLEGDLFPFYVDPDGRLMWRDGHPGLPQPSDRNDPFAVVMLRRSLDRTQIELEDVLPALAETEDLGPAARWLHRTDPDLFDEVSAARRAVRAESRFTEAEPAAGADEAGVSIPAAAVDPEVLDAALHDLVHEPVEPPKQAQSGTTSEPPVDPGRRPKTPGAPAPRSRKKTR